MILQRNLRLNVVKNDVGVQTENDVETTLQNTRALLKSKLRGTDTSLHDWLQKKIDKDLNQTSIQASLSPQSTIRAYTLSGGKGSQVALRGSKGARTDSMEKGLCLPEGEQLQGPMKRSQAGTPDNNSARGAMKPTLGTGCISITQQFEGTTRPMSGMSMRMAKTKVICRGTMDQKASS